ncbi:MAG: hypothetical protein WBM46_08915 [Polyangiales bacterium]
MDRSTLVARWPMASIVVVSVLTGCTNDSVIIDPRAVVSQPAEAIDPYADSPSRFGRVPLHAGFSPDPQLVAGIATGEVQAATIHRRCRGWVAEMPDYLLEADTAFLQIYLLGRSRSSISLVLRKPDGSVSCSRNKTMEPMIRSDLPIGASQIWVGVEEEGTTASYQLGFSEVKWKPSSIPLPEPD